MTHYLAARRARCVLVRTQNIRVGHNGIQPEAADVGRLRVSCFPSWGFMFSLSGVSCFPSWGFMFSPYGFHVFLSQAGFMFSHILRFGPTPRAGPSSVRHPWCCHRRNSVWGFMFSCHSRFHVFPSQWVSCFPSQGFMFSHLGFHVFPRRVSCFPLNDPASSRGKVPSTLMPTSPTASCERPWAWS